MIQSPARRVNFIFALAILAIGLASCQADRGPAGPPGPSSIHLSGSIARDWYGAPITAQIQVFESPSIPSAAINGLVCTLSNNGQYGHFDFELSDSSFQAGDSFHIEVQYQDPASGPALAYADVILPGSFEITSHDSDLAQIPFGADLVLEWNASAGADCYFVDIYFHYSFWDTLGLYRSFWLETDTLIADTTITFDAERIFPQAGLFGELNPSLSNGWIDLRAESGPWQAGDQANVHGDGNGIIRGRTFGAHLFLLVIE